MTDSPESVQSLTIPNGQSYTIGVVKYMVPTDYLCIKDGVILQLWYNKHSFNENVYKEWRPLKSFEEMSKELRCDFVAGE